MTTLNYNLTEAQANAIVSEINTVGQPTTQAEAATKFSAMAIQQSTGGNTTLGLIATNASDVRIINFMENSTGSIDPTEMVQISTLFTTIDLNAGTGPAPLLLRYVAL